MAAAAVAASTAHDASLRDLGETLNQVFLLIMGIMVLLMPSFYDCIQFNDDGNDEHRDGDNDDDHDGDGDDDDHHNGDDNNGDDDDDNDDDHGGDGDGKGDDHGGMMQCGFAFLEAGSVRSKNTSNILIKNLLDSFVAGIAYWTLGYAFAHGDGNEFIGWTGWASHELPTTELASFFFQFVFAATAATIVSGALAERCEFVAYFVYSFCITSFIYPVVTHWAWHEDGWLNKGHNYTIDGEGVVIKYSDFAGSGVVHCVGGVAAFVGALILGPRLGRYHGESGTVVSLRGHSVPFAALGGFILLFGFMAFNGGSQLTISNSGDGAIISLAIVNTVISGSMAAFTSLIIHRYVPETGLWG
ncbi:ammonium transporter [Elysia marginata]|uniref:Ammonium transporter n=1 Tax=Elysia marginata TaxID=1093978 RepID=A0AAV4J3M2_9GAST|nr:ammonium transporter [Elysia marginata]